MAAIVTSCLISDIAPTVMPQDHIIHIIHSVHGPELTKLRTGTCYKDQKVMVLGL